MRLLIVTDNFFIQRCENVCEPFEIIWFPALTDGGVQTFIIHQFTEYIL